MQTTKNKPQQIEMSKKSIDLPRVLNEGKFESLRIFVLAVESVRIGVYEADWTLAEV